MNELSTMIVDDERMTSLQIAEITGKRKRLRFCDLQRWLLLTEAPYNQKFSQEFDRVESADFYTKNDPKDVAG